jgi:GT2 family glycosyltransferase
MIRTSPPKILLHNITDQSSGFYRLALPAVASRHAGLATTIIDPRMQTAEQLDILQPDIIVMQHPFLDGQLKSLRSYRKYADKNKTFLVYEIDDLLWDIPDTNPSARGFPPDMMKRIREAALLCDCVTTTTLPLAIALRKLGLRDVRLAPNKLANSFFNQAMAGRRGSHKGTKPRVGWAGGIQHGADIALLHDTIIATAEEVEWHFMGIRPEGVDESLYTFHPYVKIEDYAKTLGALHLDIAVAPLADNAFNRCKSNLKLIEYGAAGFAVIASDIDPYRDAPVRLVDNSPESWTNAIRELAGSKQAEEQAEALHTWAKDNYRIEDALPHWLAAWSDTKTLPFVPSSQVSDETTPIVTVGVEIEGIDRYGTIEEAHNDAPKAHIAYIREGATVTSNHLRLAFDALQNRAAIIGISNDGDYPKVGSFTAMPPDMARDITEAASLANAGLINTVPYPSGPFALLSCSALARVGTPAVDKFNGDTEMALVDWGVRAAEHGYPSAQMPEIYVYSGLKPLRDMDLTRKMIDHVSAWIPLLSQSAKDCARDPIPAQARKQLDLTYFRLNYTEPLPTSYDEWLRLQEIVSEHPIRDCAGPLISVIMPVYNTPAKELHLAINSVLAQTYTSWELCIANDGSTEPHVEKIIREYAAKDKRIKHASLKTNKHICTASNVALALADGEWFCGLDHDDTLSPHALWAVAHTIQENPNVEFIYTDSDKIGPKGESLEPLFNCDFNYELILGQNYVTHLSVYKLKPVMEMGGFREGFEGSQDYDLTLRYLEARCWLPEAKRPDDTVIVHIPHVLYHWRQMQGSVALDGAAKPYAFKAASRAILEHINRTEQAAVIAPHPLAPAFTMTRYLIANTPPKVGIIVLTKDGGALLNNCISALINNTNYPDKDIIVVDNGSTDKETVKLLRMIEANKVARVIRRPGKFNFSQFNNDAAKLTNAPVLCFLNDDCIPSETVWLHDMVATALRPSIGAVGARLVYPDGRLQHTGITFNSEASPGESALHSYAGLPLNNPGPFGHAVLMREWSAVTGACMVVTRKVFESVGGFNIAFPIDYNDIDLCLRLREAGYHNVVVPQALLIHHEGSTKRRSPSINNRERLLEDEARLLRRHPHMVDRNFNPNTEYNPGLQTLARKPPKKAWGPSSRLRTLILNGTPEDALRAAEKGYTPYLGRLEGPYLVIQAPAMANVLPYDLREQEAVLMEMLGWLDIDTIVVRSLGAGSFAILGILTILAERGFPIVYDPIDHEAVCPRLNCSTSMGPCGNQWLKEDPSICQRCIDTNGSPNGYVTVPSYRLTWMRFLSAIKPSEVDLAAD